MSDAPGIGQTASTPNIAGRIVELKVSGNLMTLDVGLFCLFQQPGMAPPPQDGSGLPGVRISVPPQVQTPNPAQAPAQGQVTIKGLHEDGWLGPQGGAALVQVVGAPAQILITVYQSPNHPADTAPRLQVVPLSASPAQAAMGDKGKAGQAGTAPPPARAQSGSAPLDKMITDKDIVAHVQRMGDVGVALGEWLGTPGSGDWIEGFGITPQHDIPVDDIEYQAVLGKGWLSPWVTDGKFCGSRGMALPLLGFNLRLRGKTAEQFQCHYRASFLDGTRIGPIAAGKSCEAASLSPLEAFQVILRPRPAATAPAKQKTSPAQRVAPAKPAPKPAPKIAARVAANPVAKISAKPPGKLPAKPSGKTASRPVAKQAAPSAMPARKRGR